MEQISGVTIEEDSVNCNLAFKRLRWIATTGVNVSIDPVLEKSAPVLLGKLLADAREGRMKHVFMALLRISLRLVVLGDCSLFLLDTYIMVLEGGEVKPIPIVVGANASTIQQHHAANETAYNGLLAAA
eukprot:CAMPEP_0202020614 /NCGR_PEP_ID=MMETSP0905-20130828/44886_1 /ASSEMBLY_ACC=CAM_ASM_000554 /TAXON_ID=420261 /ORGANISM="Thalassiosira antarctica, Strain CCMP982" /LENGTH=128 /DNA_ID=CAMNT_0048582241 /DNA_START=161 /DNA_END=543 /DNA_ORIENTATION=+